MPRNEYLLHSTAKGSDKVYKLEVVKRADGYYDVVYSNGRRSSGPTSGNKRKNVEVLSLQGARWLLDSLANDKMAEGYHVIGDCSVCFDNVPVSSAEVEPIHIARYKGHRPSCAKVGNWSFGEFFLKSGVPCDCDYFSSNVYQGHLIPCGAVLGTSSSNFRIGNKECTCGHWKNVCVICYKKLQLDKNLRCKKCAKKRYLGHELHCRKVRGNRSGGFELIYGATCNCTWSAPDSTTDLGLTKSVCASCGIVTKTNGIGICTPCNKAMKQVTQRILKGVKTSMAPDTAKPIQKERRLALDKDI